MPTICLQCAMRAVLDGQPNPVFEETPAEHMARHHADVAVLLRERQDLERRLLEMIDRMDSAMEN